VKFLGREITVKKVAVFILTHERTRYILLRRVAVLWVIDKGPSLAVTKNGIVCGSESISGYGMPELSRQYDLINKVVPSEDFVENWSNTSRGSGKRMKE
jgi:hypothetical protein